MQFLWPVLLWLLILVPLVAIIYIWAQRRRKKFVLRYSSLMVVQRAQTRGSVIRRHAPAVLFLLALMVMILSLARPYGTVMLPAQEATVILTIDVSGSMRTPDMRPNRIEAAKAAARVFVQQQAPSTRIGLVAFSSTASIVQMPTVDHQAVLDGIDRLYLQRSTAIGSGILASINAIYGNMYTDTFGGEIAPSNSGAEPTPVAPGTHIPAVVILLTDGANVQGPSPVEAAQKAADLGIRVYTIAVGVPSGSTPPGASPNSSNPGPNGRNFNRGGGGFGGPNGGGFGGNFGGGGFRTEVDEALLQQVAQMTDGEYFRATDSNALTQIYKGLDTQVIVRTEKIEVTALMGAAAGVLAIGSIALAMLWSGRFP